MDGQWGQLRETFRSTRMYILVHFEHFAQFVQCSDEYRSFNIFLSTREEDKESETRKTGCVPSSKGSGSSLILIEKKSFFIQNFYVICLVCVTFSY